VSSGAGSLLRPDRGSSGFTVEPSRPDPEGVGCGQRNDHEHERLDAQLRVRSFPANHTIPAGSTTSADFSTTSSALTDATVPYHPTSARNGADGHLGTPAETSPGKASNLHRAPTASTQRPLDDNGLRCNRPARPDRLASYAQPTNAVKASMRHVFLGSRLRLRLPSHPASRRRSCPWLVVGVISSTGDLHPRAADHAGRTRVAGTVARPGSHRTVRTLFVYGSSGPRVANPAAGRFATSKSSP